MNGDNAAAVECQQTHPLSPRSKTKSADLTVAAFDVIRALLARDSAAADKVIRRIDETQGWRGLLAFVRALSLLTIEITGVKPQAIAAMLADEGDAVIARTFFVVDPQTGEHTPLDDEQRAMVVCALQFMTEIVDDANLPTVMTDFQQAHRLHHPVAFLISGVLMVTMSAIGGLPLETLDGLRQFMPDRASVLDEFCPGEPEESGEKEDR